MKPELIFSIIALLFSGITVYLNIIYRRKDFYNQLLREQVAAGYFIMESLFKLNHSLNEGYSKYVGIRLAEHLEKTGETPDEDQLINWQGELIGNIDSEYMTAFSVVIARGFIFPGEIQKELENYFRTIGNVLENGNNAEFGVRLRELNGPLMLINRRLNSYLKIEKLSSELNKRL